MLNFRAIFCVWIVLLMGGCSTGSFHSLDKEGGKEIYRIAFDSSWYSLGEVPQGPALNGFFYDLIQSIGEVAGVVIQPVEVQEPNLLVGLQNKSYEGVCTLIYPYSYAQQEYAFSDPVLLTGTVLVASTASANSVPSSLVGRRIGVLEGPFYEQQIQRIPGVFIEKVLLVPDAFYRLQNKTMDFFLVEIARFLPYSVGLWEGKVRVVSGALDDQGLRLAVTKKAEHGLLPLWEQAVKTLRKNGTYNALLNKWGLWHLQLDNQWGRSLACQGMKRWSVDILASMVLDEADSAD